MRPLAIDLFCGLGGWTEGLLAEGYRVVGFDTERHVYGEAKYPAQLVIQDVLTLHGSQFKTAALIVASPPCQEYSYMAMPWSRAKKIAADYRSGVRDVRRLTALFDACFRIQREAIEAAGCHIPLVVENVRGAIPWVGRSRWNFGSFHLWGDVPALMPMVKPHETRKKPAEGTGDQFCAVRVDQVDESRMKAGIVSVRHLGCTNFHQSEATRATKNDGGSWFNIGSPGQRVTNQNPVHRRISEAHRSKSPAKGYGHVTEDGIKHGGDCFSDPNWPGKQGGVKQPGIGGPRANGKGDAWFQDGAARHGSKSNARKAASAHIAKIPFPLSSWIAKAWKP